MNLVVGCLIAVFLIAIIFTAAGLLGYLLYIQPKSLEKRASRAKQEGRFVYLLGVSKRKKKWFFRDTRSNNDMITVAWLNDKDQICTQTGIWRDFYDEPDASKMKDLTRRALYFSSAETLNQWVMSHYLKKVESS
ncbi:MAG: hypothetical protein WC508_02545 [Patescibacteria group bacterium]